MTEQQLTLIDIQQQKKKFVVGIVLIVLSLLIGKLALIPLILFPTDEQWRNSMVAVYIFSWAILIPGIYFAGIEGYKLVHHKYREYHQKTISHMKHHGGRMAAKTRVLTSQARSRLDSKLENARSQLEKMRIKKRI